MTMKSNFLYSLLIVAASIQFSTGAISNTVDERQRRPNQLRGSTSPEDGERSLDGSSVYYSSGNHKANGSYGSSSSTQSSSNQSSSNHSNGNQNGYYRYRHRGYYRKYRNYYPRQYYGNYYAPSKGYYSNTDEYDNQEEYYVDDDVVKTRDKESSLEAEVEEQFWEWYESPPADWTAAQWAWFSGLLSFSVGLLFCCCLGCTNMCVGGEPEYNDAYRNIESEKSGSFMTLNSRASNTSATGGNASLHTNPSEDDDQTYDSIMRMRSS